MSDINAQIAGWEDRGQDAWEAGADIVAVQDAVAELTRIRAARNWQPIETAPRDGTKILICDAEGEMAVVFFDVTAGPIFPWQFANTVGAYRDDVPTHWMALPIPPAREETP
jgi:hypothetical protein